jgi:hypothetical protein
MTAGVLSAALAVTEGRDALSQSESTSLRVKTHACLTPTPHPLRAFGTHVQSTSVYLASNLHFRGSVSPV